MPRSPGWFKSKPHKHGKTNSDLALPDQQPNPDTPSGSSEKPPVPSFPDGAKVLHDCSDAVIDVCFIHGLTGDRDNTWTADKQSTPWPATLLPQKLDKARILTYGYDAYVVRRSAATTDHFNDHASNLLKDLTDDRTSCKAARRPIIFVAHSLGGIVCKKAILLSRNSPEAHIRTIFEFTIGIAFMGTPHRGSWMAGWAKIPASVLGVAKSTNTSLLDILSPRSEFLEDIRERFAEMIREKSCSLKVVCFYEGLPSYHDVSVVSKDSATIEGHGLHTIHANHRDMVRFASVEDNGFKRLVGELLRWKSLVVQSQPETLTPGEQNCLKSLAFLQMLDRCHDISRATEGTCEWLLRHGAYTSWAASDQGLLWIKGKPGSGKSTLLKYALEHYERVPRTQSSPLVLSFFFHWRGEDLQKTPLGFFRSLLHQVLGRAPNALSGLVTAFEDRSKEIGEIDKKWQWHRQELQHFFELSLSKILETRAVYLFIDALDECGENNAVDLFHWLKSLSKDPTPTYSRLHICITCRHYPILGLECEFEICPEHENADDISTFVQSQLSQMAGSLTPALITNRASGVFMWARLVVERVLALDRRGEALGVIKKVVYSLPPDLDKLYHELIQNMDSESLKLIQWICFATRPLSLDELRWAMVIDPSCPSQSLQECRNREDYVSDNDRMERKIKTLSFGLAETMESSHGSIVQFIHQSVDDFFLERGLATLDPASLSTNAAIGIAHYQLSRICICYLMMDEIRSATSYDEGELPFLHYATTSWVTHLKACDSKNIIQTDILELLSWSSNVFVEVWINIYRAIDRWSRNCPPMKSTLLHILSSHGVEGLVMAILQRATRDREYFGTKEDKHMTLTSQAAPDKHGVLFNIDLKDRYGQTPLLLAAQNEHEVIVKLLLNTHQVNVNSKDEEGRTPLLWAVLRGHEAIAKLLLATGEVDVSLKDILGRAPVFLAAEKGHEGIVMLLLNTGQVDVNLKHDKYGWTLLLWAVRNRHEGIVKLLLNTGQVNVNLKDIWGHTPLLLAAKDGHMAIVKLLLNTGQVDVNLKDDGYGWTPLLWAAMNGHEAIAEQLLNRCQVDVNLKDDKYGRTLLSWAAREGHVAIVKLLLNKGQVNVDLKDRYGQTPLSQAARSGHEAIVKLLLNTGQVNVDSKDRFGQTSLLRAARNGHEAIVKLLLNTGQVNVDSKDDDYGQTSLLEAAMNGHEAIVKLLLNTGQVNVDSKDKSDRTPLLWATKNGHEAVVKLLLDTGQVNVDSKDRYGKTPVWWATENRHESIVELLKSV